MRHLLRAFVLGGLLAVAAPALAAEFSDAEKSAINARVAELGAAMQNADWAGVVATVPPKVIDHIAAENSIAVADLLAEMVRLTEEGMQTVTITDFGMDTAATEYREAADGTPYALIPTFTVIDLGEAGGSVRATSMTLGIIDEGAPQLIRTEDAATIAIIRQVYPAFAEVEFPAGSMEAVE